ncbi:MAG TPA: Ig-like domain repeat protein, partial [Candidatus Limnocylindrales bacterium]|nr:Ig-like domain repeat protein [Candidatus Limnocylindrales bacterium]
MMRKAIALVVAYSFFATSIWSLALPGERLPGRRSATWTTLAPMLPRPLPSAAMSGNDLLVNQGASPARHIFTNMAALNAMEPPLQTGGATTTIGIFGPQQYVRTTGDPNSYTTVVQVPAWVASPFNMHIQCGEADGTNRVSSATILVNGVQVAGTDDFNTNVFTLDRAVTLTPQTTLLVTLASKPGSYLRINLSGANQDHTPPVLTIAAPGNSTSINTPLAHLDIHYQDLVGVGEPAASGVNTTTLQVLLDGVDRTSLFTRRSDEATADLPASLALTPGPHTLAASIKDNAGNTAQATSQFQLDVTPPSLQVLQPAAGAYLNTVTPQIQFAYGDNVGINTQSLKVLVNGVDQSAQFTATATGASGSPTLTTGANELVATISDQAGNTATASAAFNLDTAPPSLTILHPAPASRHGSSSVLYSIQYSDDQAIDLNSLQVIVDGAAVAVTPTLTGASGSVALADGAHSMTASIRDKAGNQTSASSAFSVDTQIPGIHIVLPAPGAVLNNPTPQIQVAYSDADIDVNSLRVTLDATDITALFSATVTATGASAALPTPLAEGPHTIAAQIADLTGNVGQTSNTLLVDTIKPQITISSPSGPINTINPSALAQYSDSGSGIDPNSVHAFLDATDLTTTFSIGDAATAGVLSGVSEGQHQFRVTVADKAGNVAEATSSFLVDITPPQATFANPADNSFTNNTLPSVVLNYSDGLSGVDPASVHIFLQPLNSLETEITAQFTLGAGQATGTVPAVLAPGTYHLRAQIADKAGNITNVDSAFAVDTTAPTYNIDTPAANAYLNTATPTFTVTYQDDSSGVDPA